MRWVATEWGSIWVPGWLLDLWDQFGWPTRAVMKTIVVSGAYAPGVTERKAPDAATRQTSSPR